MAERKVEKVATPKTEADKAKKFIEVGQKRVARMLKSVEALGGLANKRSYTYTPEQVKAIEEALGKAWESVRLTFAGKKNLADTFKF